MEKVRTGSTREMTAVKPGVIALKYTDQWSAFDRGASKQRILDIGPARCACAVKSFDLARDLGLQTHFTQQIDPVTIHVEEFSVPGRESLSGKLEGRVIPLEWITRSFSEGFLNERLEQKLIDPVSLGFPKGTKTVPKGTKLPRPFLECSTKFELVDRYLSDDEARALGELTQDQWIDAQHLIFAADRMTGIDFNSVGFTSRDRKKELGMRNDGAIVLVDVFGTQDEERIVDTAGELYSKDLIRNYLKTLPWKKELDAAKKAYPEDKSKWPEYPLLPDKLVELVSKRYKEFAFRYAGVGI